jgi:ABC-type transporter Mla maintaining outer membrane lipid asymmetry ATPase subunit MlaF
MTGDTISPINLAFWAANVGYSSAETAGRFSALSKKNDIEEVTRVFREHFPVVEDLSVEISAGSPMVFAKVSRYRRIPLNLISGGMTKLSSILFAIPSMPSGIMIIDEIENGFYYKRFPIIWSALNALTKKYDVQVFVSTHSLECLRAAADEAKNDLEDFSLIRAQRDDGKITLKQFSGAQFVGSVEADLEIR